MLALDLFNNDHERRLAEGAVDQLEQRRIDDLAMKMDDLVARAKNPAYKKNPAALSALMKEFQKCKDERDSYYKIRNETMGYSGLTSEAGIPGNVPTEKIPGKEDLLKGKGRTYYEGDEGEWSKEGSWTKIPKNKAGQPVDPRGEVAHLSDVARRKAERKAQDQKKNPKEVAEADKPAGQTPLDQRLQRLKVQARREFPRAHSDEEALLLKLLDKESHDAELNRHVDARQDAEIKRNFKFDNEQEDEIHDLQTSVGIKEHGGGIGPKQRWQDLMQERKLSVGDAVIVTAPNEFEGKTGEIAEFSPSGKFVVVNLYNHGEHSMHLSDVEYNQYADDENNDDWYDEGVAEGWSDAVVARRTGGSRTPYSVYINGKKWKDFADDDHAEAVANKLRAKFKAEGRDPSVITIAPTDTSEGVAETVTDVRAGMAEIYRRLAPKIEHYKDSFLAGQLYDELENYAELHGAETEFKRMMNGARNRAHMEYDTNPGGFHNWFWFLPFGDEITEEQDTSGVESAIIRRIMVAHVDWLQKFGPEKVMQAAEEVAYDVGDVDEIGTSDVSAYVHQVGQILGVDQLNEKWSKKYKSSINCASPKGFSQRAHCAGKKK
jgi:hypothetical protein